jgi:thiol reductant ABC exporter CydD subunit
VRPVDPRLLRRCRSARHYLVTTVLLGTALGALVLCQAWLLADLLTRAVRGAALGDLARPMALFAGLVVVRAGLSYLQETAAHRASSRVTAELRAEVLRHVADTGAPVGTGATAVLVTRGIDALDGYFAKFLPQLVLACLVPPAVLLQVGLVDWVSAVVIGVTLPLVPVFMILIGMFSQRAMGRQWRTLAVLSGHYLDVVAGLPTLKVFGRAKAQAQTLRQVADDHRRATTKVLRVAFLSALVLEAIATLSVALVAVGVGLRLLDGNIGLRAALVVLILAPEAYLPLRNVGAAFHASAEGLGAASEVLDLLERPLPTSGTSYAVPDPARVPVELTHVTVRYDGAGAAAVSDLTLTLAPGRMTALVGRSGSGKTSLLSVLRGEVIPTRGTVRVGGTDLASLAPEAWRRQVAWLPQRPLLFAGTIADNVRLGEPDATDEEVLAVLALAAADFVRSLPRGVATELGDQGAGLSAGQRQRVALARVLLRATRRGCGLVLLDEPTAHLDHDTEQRVARALHTVLAGRTVLAATHRPALVAVADHALTATGRPLPGAGTARPLWVAGAGSTDVVA